MSRALLKEFIIHLLKEENKTGKKLVIFDFDDTLVKTTSRVKMKKHTGEEQHLTPAEYAVYDKHPEDQFDYSDFSKVVEPKPIIGMVEKLKSELENRSHVVILTARGPAAAPGIKKYLKKQVDKTIPVIALGDSNPDLKAIEILKFASKGSYDEIEFYDDSAKNIAAAEQIKNTIKRLGYKTTLSNVHVKGH